MIFKQMAESSVNQLSNLKISSEKIYFSPDNQTAQLTLMNTHQNLHIYFKIKTKIEKVFDVKPVLGVIKPGEKQMVSFKPFKKLQDEAIRNMEANLQFLIKAVNSENGNLKKEQEDKLWREIKEKHHHIDMGYCSVKMNIAFTDRHEDIKEFVPPFSKPESKVENKFTSQLKASKGPKAMSNLFDSRQSHQNLTDTELSKKYEELKSQQLKLIKQRQNMFHGPGEPGSSGKKKSSFLIMLIVFLFALLLGNYLKGALTVSDEPEEASLLDWFS